MRPKTTVFTALCLLSQLVVVQGQTKPANPTTITATAPGMHNSDVVKMVKAGLAESLVVTVIKRAQPRAFDLSANGLVSLKVAGVTDAIIAAMLEVPSSMVHPVSATTAASAVPLPRVDKVAGTPRPTDLPSSLEIGAYYQRNGAWTELLPDVVNWKTGGILKHIASAGLIGGDVNGFVAGPSSRTSLKLPAEILVYTPEGSAITEYQLLWLRPQRNSREFRTITGGVMHASSGAMRDLVPFESKKVGSRTHKILLPDLEPGEYGILPPGSVLASSASAPLGKIYTFAVD